MFYHEYCFLIGYVTHYPFKQQVLLSRNYLNNRVFLSRNYRLIVAPRKFDVLKTNICPRSEASRANMLVLRTSNFQGATIRPIVPRHNTPLSLLFTTKFSSARQFKNHIELFSTFSDESRISQKENTKTHLTQFQLYIFCKSRFLQRNFHGRLLSIQVFSADGHYGLIVSLRG